VVALQALQGIQLIRDLSEQQQRQLQQQQALKDSLPQDSKAAALHRDQQQQQLLQELEISDAWGSAELNEANRVSTGIQQVEAPAVPTVLGELGFKLDRLNYSTTAIACCLGSVYDQIHSL